MGSNEQRIKLHHIAHVYYKHKDIEAARTFMADFGFVETERIGARTFFRGYGKEPFVMALEEGDESEFGGAAFAVESEEELERAARILPPEARATPVHEVTDAPGGGKRVTFYDPVDGFPFHLVHGQASVEPRDPKFPVLKVNYVSVPTLRNEDPCRKAWLTRNSPTRRIAQRTSSSGSRRDRLRSTSWVTSGYA